MNDFKTRRKETMDLLVKQYNGAILLKYCEVARILAIEPKRVADILTSANILTTLVGQTKKVHVRDIAKLIELDRVSPTQQTCNRGNRTDKE